MESKGEARPAPWLNRLILRLVAPAHWVLVPVGAPDPVPPSCPSSRPALCCGPGKAVEDAPSPWALHPYGRPGEAPGSWLWISAALIQRQEPGASPGLPWGAGPKQLNHPPLHSWATAESWPGRGATGTESGAPTGTRTQCAGATRQRISLLSHGTSRMLFCGL